MAGSLRPAAPWRPAPPAGMRRAQRGLPRQCAGRPARGHPWRGDPHMTGRGPSRCERGRGRGSADGRPSRRIRGARHAACRGLHRRTRTGGRIEWTRAAPRLLRGRAASRVRRARPAWDRPLSPAAAPAAAPSGGTWMRTCGAWGTGRPRRPRSASSGGAGGLPQIGPDCTAAWRGLHAAPQGRRARHGPRPLDAPMSRVRGRAGRHPVQARTGGGGGGWARGF